MAIAIYADVETDRHHFADSTSQATLANLAAGRWVLFDATPDTPPPPGDPLDNEMAERVPGSGAFASALRAAFVLPKPGDYTYNLDGTVATGPDGETYAYNSDGTLHTITLNGVIRTLSYNSDLTIASVA